MWRPGFIDRHFRGILAAVLLAAGLVRLAILIARWGRLEDPDNYLVLARSLADGHGLALYGRLTAYRPPLYPLVLVPFVASLGARAVWGIAGLHVALGLATVAFTADAAKRWGLSPGRVLIASAIAACDPVLASQAGGVMTEALAACLVAVTLAGLARGGTSGALLGGISFGLSALCRPSLLSGAVLTVLSAVAFGPGGYGVRLRRAAVLLLATAATMVPWAWRNARVFGEPVCTTTHGGYTLALANNPVYYADVLDGPPGAVWSGSNQQRWFEAMNRAAAGLSEPEADRRYRAEGLRMLAERPGDFLRASLARLGRFWGVAPAGAVFPRWLRLATAVWTVPLWVAFLAGLVRRDLWTWPRAAAPAIIAGLAIVHAIYWTDLRMRAPVVPAIALVASTAKAGGLFRLARARARAADL
jgi:hypothetical protein